MGDLLEGLPSGDQTHQPAAGAARHRHRRPKFAEGVKLGWLECICLQMPAGIGQGKAASPSVLLGRLSQGSGHQFGEVLMLGRVQPGLPEGSGPALVPQGKAHLARGEIPKGQLQRGRARLCVLDFATTLFGVQGGKWWILCPHGDRKSHR